MSFATPVRVGSEFVVNTTVGNNQFNPSIAALADGRFVVSWTDFSLSGSDPTGAAIRAGIFNFDGSQSKAEFLVNTTTAADQYSSRVTALENGGFTVTWRDSSAMGSDMSSFAVRAQVFSPTGAKLRGEILVNSTTDNSQLDPVITTLADGRFLVTWSDYSQSSDDPSVGAVRGQIFTAAGTESGSEFLINTTTANSQFQPSVTALADGGFVVSWTDDVVDGNFSGIRAQIYSAAGVKIGGEIAVNTITASDQHESSIAALAEGGFVVTWTNYSGTGGDTSAGGIQGQVFTDTGAKLRGKFLVNTTTTNGQLSSEVTGLSDGRFIVTWVDSSNSGEDTSNYAIRAQVFSATGQKHGDEFVVNTTTTNTQQDPAVTELADGRIVFSWTDLSFSGSDPSGSAVRAQIFDPRLTAVELIGTRLNDQYMGTVWGDRIAGRWGHDNVWGRSGDDRLSGDEGNDALQGGSGRDILEGGVGNDQLAGQRGADEAYGGTGNDLIQGGYDADLLSGGTGLNTLQGGFGADWFVFDTTPDGTALADRIQDFQRNNDNIVLDVAVFAGIGTEGPLAAGRFRVGAALDANDRILYKVTGTGDARVGTLSYDADGSGAAAAVAFAILSGGPSLTAADILVL